MFKDITQYAPRRKGRRGPIPQAGKRERNGRLSRAAAGGVYMVYFVSLEGNPRIKVGRTQNIQGRLLQYQHAGGSEARCLAQLLVANVADSVALEADAVRYLASRYPRHGREWFEMPESHLGAAITGIVSVSAVSPTEVRGAPGLEQQDTAFVINKADADAIAASYKLKRGRRHW